MSAQQQVFARRWGYGYEDIPEVERGQVLNLHGSLNDDKLLRLGYVMPLPSKQQKWPCGVCGAEFIGLAELNAHGDKRHVERFRSPDLIPVETQYKGSEVTVFVEAGDAAGEVREASEAGPAQPDLFLDKTAAARQADNALVVEPDAPRTKKGKRGRK